MFLDITKDELFECVDIKSYSDCWFFQGFKDRQGYGHLWIDGLQYLAHRVFYEVYNKPIPKGLVIDHLCNNKNCVNPKHLEAVTNSENLARYHKRKIIILCPKCNVIHEDKPIIDMEGVY